MYKFSAVIVLLIAFTATEIMADSATDHEFQAFFQSFKAKRDGIGSLEATFIQKTITPDEILETEGTLYYSKPRRIMFVTKNPERIMLVDGRRGYEYDAEIKQVTIFDIEDNPQADIFFLGFDDNTEALQKTYQVSLLITDDARGRQGIKIQPRPESDTEAYFTEVNLLLRDEDYLPYRIHIVNDAESQVYLDVQNMTTHAAKDDEKTRMFIPAGVKIIENDVVVDTVAGDGRYLPAQDAGPKIESKELLPEKQE